MNTKIAEELLENYQAGTCTADERLAVELWYESLEKKSSNLDEVQKNELAVQIKKHIDRKNGRLKTRTYKLYIPIAAAALALIILGVYFFRTSRSSEFPYASRILPGKNTAVLTLADGHQIPLSDAHSGVTTNTKQLLYTDGAAVSAASVEDNESTISKAIGLTTPRGGMYHVVLPDGTDAWLNSDTEINYRAVYKNDILIRKVILTGEACFKVAKLTQLQFRGQKNTNQGSKRVPFVVESRGQEIEVLGTYFNVSAYSDDEQTKTTLIEGSVKINDVRLKPNQQANLSNGKIQIKQVNAEDAISWKNGTFSFNNEPLEEVMQKIARWYNVNVEYTDYKLKTQNVYGTISRFSDIADVIDLLELTGTIKIKTVQNKIIISKK